jgi:8-oxo-dGTP pyrophosphatase MutT (NUDIX family)
MSFSHVIKAGVILYYGSKVLLVKEHGGKWGFPKGRVEDGIRDPAKNDYGDPKNTAVRELFEETGIIVDPSILSEDDKVTFYDDTAYLYYVDLEVYENEITIPDVIIENTETVEMEWFTRHYIHKNLIYNSLVKHWLKVS